MNLEKQWRHRVLLSSIFLLSIYSIPSACWQHTLALPQQLSSNITHENLSLSSEMKFFMWYQSYAIYGAREKLILLKPVLYKSSMEIFSYNWSIDPLTLEECLQEWNIKEKCYNDIVHVRILPNSSIMDVYCTYAHRPMVRSFDLQNMSFLDDDVPIRDPHPPMDSEHSYVMLTFNSSIVTAGYQGDYIPTIRGSQGKTLLYALRQNSYFIGGFKYDGKAVFGVIESSDRIETNRVSRLVMACANRAEIIRKATLNCSTDQFDQSRSFVFHILTDLVDPIPTSNGSVLLFATFTTTDSFITASAVCLFILDQQFYDVFTSPSIKNSRPNDMNDLIYNCSHSIPSTIDRDMVESEKQFLPYLSNPLLIETMSTHIFTALDVIQYKPDRYCLIIGTSNGRLFTAFTDSTLKTHVFEELILPMNRHDAIKSIAHKNVSFDSTDNHSYVVIATNQLGYFTVKLTSCETRLCLQCWVKDCRIEKISRTEMMITSSCSSENNIRVASDQNNQSADKNERTIEGQSRNTLLFCIVIPLSFIVLLLCILIIILLTKLTRKIKRGHFYPTHSRKTRDSSSAHTYTNNIMYRTHNNKLFVEQKSQSHVFPTKSELCVRRTSSNPVYSTTSSQSLPSLVLPATILSKQLQPLSVQRLYKNDV